MAPPDSGPSESKHDGIKQSTSDAVSLVVRYLKQETLTVVKALRGYVLFGILGSLVLTVGVVLLLVAFLRLLQTETAPTLSGNLSWLPYVIVCVAAILVIGLCVWLIMKGARRRSEGSGRRGATGDSTEGERA